MPLQPDQIDLVELKKALNLPAGRKKVPKAYVLDKDQTSVKLPAVSLEDPIVARNGAMLTQVANNPKIDQFSWKDDEITLGPGMKKGDDLAVFYWIAAT